MATVLILDEDLAIPINDESVNWDSGYQSWFFISEGVWYIQAGTMWDGATAVPDGKEDPDKPGYPILWLASLIHDLGYMGLDDDSFPLSRNEIDRLFRRFMKQSNFKYRKIYYFGVRYFGYIWNTVSMWYRKTFKIERSLPAHISDYSDNEHMISLAKMLK